jgi:hypothetical protein
VGWKWTEFHSKNEEDDGRDLMQIQREMLIVK